MVTVVNVAPTVAAGTDATIDEGGTFTRTGSFTDPGTDSWTATVDYGDGSGAAVVLNADKTFALNHSYADNGTFTITVCVKDDDLGAGQDSLVVTVVNVAPTVAAGTDATVDEGGSSPRGIVHGSWHGLLDGNRGLRRRQRAQPLAINADKTFVLNHAYADNGTYTVTAQIRDDDMPADTWSVDVLVVTVGSNPINNPPNAQGQTVTVTDDGAVAIILHGNDAETPETGLVFTITSLPTRGILKYNGVEVVAGDSFAGPPMLTYEPGIICDGTGGDSFTFTVADRGGPDSPGSVGLTSDRATVTIQIDPSVGEGQVTFDDGIVRIGGTSLNDVILITRSLDNMHLKVVLVSYEVQCQWPPINIQEVVVSNSIPLADIRGIRGGGVPATTISM